MTEKENFQQILKALVAKYKDKNVTEGDIRDILIQEAKIPINDKLQQFITRGTALQKAIINTQQDLNREEINYKTWITNLKKYFEDNIPQHLKNLKQFEESAPYVPTNENKNLLFYNSKKEHLDDIKSVIDLIQSIMDN